MTFEQDPDLTELRNSLGREMAERQPRTKADRRLRPSPVDLAMVAKEMVNRGSRVSVCSRVTPSAGWWSGRADHVTVQGAGQIADIRIDAGFWSILPGPTRAGATSPAKRR